MNPSHFWPGTWQEYLGMWDATYDSPNLLGGILIDPHTPRAAYWVWAEYAKQDAGLRLVT